MCKCMDWTEVSTLMIPLCCNLVARTRCDGQYPGGSRRLFSADFTMTCIESARLSVDRLDEVFIGSRKPGAKSVYSGPSDVVRSARSKGRARIETSAGYAPVRQLLGET